MNFQFVPDWLRSYQSNNLGKDVLAGLIVAVVLIPQAMAYGMLAGLPPSVALYSCLLPIFVYAWLGSSPTLAVGPVGLMSLMTGATLSELGITSLTELISTAHTLALLVGIVMILMRLARLGAVINYLSHPVISGFVSASAILIALSQMHHLLGVDIASGQTVFTTLKEFLLNIPSLSLTTSAIGIGGILVMLWFRDGLKGWLQQREMPEGWVNLISRSGPLVAIAAAECLVVFYALDESHQVSIVGAIPTGLPVLILPDLRWELIQSLWPSAVLIALIGYFESVSIAKSMASQKRLRIYPNQELLALGSANLASAVTGGYPVAGGFGRSMVNNSAGAQSPLASVITAMVVGLTLLLLTPLFFYLPRALLAGIIILAVLPLIDLKAFRQALAYDRADAASMLATFLIVLLVNVEIGIVVGIIMSIGLYLHRSSQPHIAVVGRVGNTEHYRNINRHSVSTIPHVLAIRVDENLYFANTNYLEDAIMNLVVEYPDVEHVVLICSSISFIDSSALESLDSLSYRLEQAGVLIHLAEVKGPVMDKLKRSEFVERIGEDRIFLSTHQAMMTLSERLTSDSKPLPDGSL